jgi:hypothetical protein
LLFVGALFLPPPDVCCVPQLRLDVVSGSYVGLDQTLRFQIDIEENTDLKKDIERMRARKVRVARACQRVYAALCHRHPRLRPKLVFQVEW